MVTLGDGFRDMSHGRVDVCHPHVPGWVPFLPYVLLPSHLRHSFNVWIEESPRWGLSSWAPDVCSSAFSSEIWGETGLDYLKTTRESWAAGNSTSPNAD